MSLWYLAPMVHYPAKQSEEELVDLVYSWSPWRTQNTPLKYNRGARRNLRDLVSPVRRIDTVHKYVNTFESCSHGSHCQSTPTEEHDSLGQIENVEERIRIEAIATVTKFDPEPVGEGYDGAKNGSGNESYAPGWAKKEQIEQEEDRREKVEAKIRWPGKF